MAKQFSKTFFTPIFRAAYVNLIKTNDYMKKPGTGEYDIYCVFEKNSGIYEQLWAAICEVAQQNGAGGRLQNQQLDYKWLIDGNTKRDKETGEIYAGFENMWAIKVHTTKQGIMSCCDANLNTIGPDQIYAGLYCRGEFNVFYYDIDGKTGVSLSMNRMQSLGYGEPLTSAGRSASEVFAALPAATGLPQAAPVQQYAPQPPQAAPVQQYAPQPPQAAPVQQYAPQPPQAAPSLPGGAFNTGYQPAPQVAPAAPVAGVPPVPMSSGTASATPAAPVPAYAPAFNQFAPTAAPLPTPAQVPGVQQFLQGRPQ